MVSISTKSQFYVDHRIFFRDSNNCRAVSSALWWAHLMILLSGLISILLCWMMTCFWCLIVYSSLVTINSEMNERINNMRLKNLLMGIADLKINANGHTNEECVVWMEKYKPDSEIMRLPCNQNHYFHRDCILNWIESTPSCPVCKVPIGLDPIKNQPNDQENNQNRNADANLSGNKGNEKGYKQLHDED